MTRSYHKAEAVVIAALFASLIVYAGPPMFPEQIYGTVTKLGVNVPDGNLITISTPDGSYTKTTLTKGGRYGWDPVFTIPVQSEDSIGAPLDSKLMFYINGNLIFNKSFEPGSTSNVNIQVSGPICGLGGCESGEDCLRCRSDCACQNTPISSLKNPSDFFIGDVPGFSVLLDTNVTTNILSLASDTATAIIPIAASLDQFNLSKIKMARGIVGNRNYAIVNYDGEKTVSVGKSSGSNAVCVKDVAVATVAEMSENCTNANEHIVNCTGASYSGFRCYNLGTTYKVTGLMHSAVIEIPLFVYSLSTGGTTTSIADVTTTGTTSSSTSGTPTRHSQSSLGYQSMSTKTNGTLKPDAPYVCKPSWSCTQYDRCQPSGKQFRICTDSAKCGVLEAKPAVEQACQYVKAYVPPVYQPPYIPPVANPTQPISEPVYQQPVIQAPDQEQITQPIVEQPKQDTSMIWVYALLGIAALTGIIVVVLYMRQSKTEASLESVEYIHTMRYNGYEEPVIRNILDQQQWQKKDINSAFDAYHKRYG